MQNFSHSSIQKTELYLSIYLLNKDSIIQLFTDSSIHPYIHSIIHSFIHSSILFHSMHKSFLLPSMHSLNISSIHSFMFLEYPSIHSPSCIYSFFIFSFNYLFIYSCISSPRVSGFTFVSPINLYQSKHAFSLYISVHLFILTLNSFVHLSIHSFIYLSIHLSSEVFFHPPTHSSLYVSIHPFIYPFIIIIVIIRSSVHLSIHSSIYTLMLSPHKTSIENSESPIQHYSQFFMFRLYPFCMKNHQTVILNRFVLFPPQTIQSLSITLIFFLYFSFLFISFFTSP